MDSPWLVASGGREDIGFPRTRQPGISTFSSIAGLLKICQSDGGLVQESSVVDREGIAQVLWHPRRSFAQITLLHTGRGNSWPNSREAGFLGGRFCIPAWRASPA
jgi:hypothetical protein